MVDPWLTLVSSVQRFNLKYDEPLSDFAFKFNLRRYIMVYPRAAAPGGGGTILNVHGRGLPSSTFQLNLSRV